MKSPWAIVSLVIILAAITYIIYDQRSQPAPGEPVKTLLPLACEGCGKAYAMMAGAQPVKCRFCGEAKAWRARACANPQCNTIFPIDPSKVSQSEGFPPCPKCKGARSREVREDEIEKV